MDIYQENLIDHYNNPRNYGSFDKASTAAKAENVSCGDSINIELMMSGKKISDIRFNGEGCAVCIASTSLLTEFVKGKNLDQCKNLSYSDIKSLLGVELSPSRIKCASIGLEALKLAIKNIDSAKK